MMEQVFDDNCLYKLAQNKAKPQTCYFCGQKKAIINSHSVPQKVLRRIAEEGWLLKHDAIMNPSEQAERGDGIKKAGNFWMLCKECDSQYFKHYENYEFGTEKPTEQILAEIALKNYLYQLNNSRIEMEACKILHEKYPYNEFILNRMKVIDADIHHFSKKTGYFRKLVQKGLKNPEFEILFYAVLPYRISMTTQGQIPLAYDMKSQPINDNFDYFTKTQSLHIAVFPQSENSIVIAFHEKRDIKYRRLRQQMKASSNEEILTFINYIIFEYTDNVFMTKTAIDIIRNNPKLSQTASENNGLPNLGNGITSWEELDEMRQVYQGPKPNDIPNFLSESMFDS